MMKRLEEHKRKAIDKEIERLRERETGIEQEHRAKMRALSLAEDKLNREVAATEERRRHLDECERLLRKKQTELENEHATRLAECDAKVRRAKEEAAHRVGLQQVQIKQLKASCEDMHARLLASEKRYQQLWDDFAEHKRRALTKPPHLEIQEAVAKAEVEFKAKLAEARREHKAAEDAWKTKEGSLTKANTRLKERVAKLVADLHEAKAAASRASMEAAALTAETLALCRSRDTEPPPAPAARDVPEKTESTEETNVALTPAQRQRLPCALRGIDPALLDEAKRAVLADLLRVDKEIASLLATGCYLETDSLILSLQADKERYCALLVSG
eukprot:Sspe_Gene.98046::Locus_71508_Transcript_2_2_Confidence_0.667_Length_1247::g.98046::m.98046